MTTQRTVAPFVFAGLWLLAAVGVATAASPSPGPSFPPPEADRAVYDFAGVLRTPTVEIAELMIDAIEGRSGAEIAVYTQVDPGEVTAAGTQQAATDLMNAWGVGRTDYNDGLIMFFDFDSSRKHGQMWLMPGSGFSFYLSAEELNDASSAMVLPYSRAGDFDSAVLAGLAYVDSQVTAEGTAALEAAVKGAVQTADEAAVTARQSLWVSFFGFIAAVVFGGLASFVTWRNRRTSLHPLLYATYADVLSAATESASDAMRASASPGADAPRLITPDAAARLKMSLGVVGGSEMRGAFDRFLELQAGFLGALADTPVDPGAIETHAAAIAKQRDELARVARLDLRGTWDRRDRAMDRREPI